MKNLDFRRLVVGQNFGYKGVRLIVCEITTRRGGWVRILATLDGLKVRLHRDCHCDRDDGEILVLDLVTEEEHLCCAACRRLVDEPIPHHWDS
jgi:hypothetical protein